jgi:hypothetical protein
MSWLPDSGWLRALDLRASNAAAVSLACWAVLGLAQVDFLYLGVLPTWVRAVFVIIALLATMLWFGRIWDLGRGRFVARRCRRAVLAQLDMLSTSEANLLRSQLEENEQTFNAAMDCPVVVGLRRKGLLVRPTGLGNPFEFPHMIPDFVWAEMQLRWGILKQLEAPPEDARSAVRRARDNVSGYKGASDRARRI